MRYRQNTLLILSVLIITVHYFFSGCTSSHSPSHSDKIVIHAAPEYAYLDIIKPVNPLSTFVGRTQADFTHKNVFQFGSLTQVSNFSRIRFSTFPQKLTPIFISYRAIRI